MQYSLYMCEMTCTMTCAILFATVYLNFISFIAYNLESRGLRMVTGGRDEDNENILRITSSGMVWKKWTAVGYVMLRF